MNQKNFQLEKCIGIFDGFIPQVMCEEAILFYKNKKKYNQAHDRWITENASVNKKSDTSLILNWENLPLWEKDFHGMMVNLYTCVKMWMNRTGIQDYYGNRDFDYDSLKIQETKTGEGYHLWHIEHDIVERMCKRIAFFILYLNDNFTAGETEFLHQEQRINPKVGRVIVAPAHFPYVHRGNPPLKNSKYIITGWLLFKTN
jgi:hypothetical protein|tara:strand:- start:3075 stop:3677 length:603 start_codon:yes stop_codon:yes gene_type:complete